jgi:hypothetical protein
MKIIKPIKGFVSVLAGTALGGAAIQQVSNIAALSGGIGSATQSLIGVGILGQSASLIPKKLFKK